MIEVGEYVRTNKGTIAKIEDVEWDLLYRITTIKPIYKHWVSKNQCYTEEVIKHSKNIIDLIEEGDYVNGKKIDAIFDSGFKIQGVAERVLCFETDFPIEKGIRAYHNYDIKSIVTKEQFASMEYKVKE